MSSCGLIFYDPSDDRIKMWGANSAGGNGQAVLDIDGDEFVWTNSAVEGDGRRHVSDGVYVKQPGGDTFVLKYVSTAANKHEQVTFKKRK